MKYLKYIRYFIVFIASLFIAFLLLVLGYQYYFINIKDWNAIIGTPNFSFYGNEDISNYREKYMKQMTSYYLLHLFDYIEKNETEALWKPLIIPFAYSYFKTSGIKPDFDQYHDILELAHKIVLSAEEPQRRAWEKQYGQNFVAWLLAYDNAAYQSSVSSKARHTMPDNEDLYQELVTQSVAALPVFYRYKNGGAPRDIHSLGFRYYLMILEDPATENREHTKVVRKVFRSMFQGDNPWLKESLQNPVLAYLKSDSWLLIRNFSLIRDVPPSYDKMDRARYEALLKQFHEWLLEEPSESKELEERKSTRGKIPERANINENLTLCLKKS